MKNKRSAFVLLITMFLVILFSIYSFSIVQNNTFSAKLNNLKYLHLQSKIYMDSIILYIKNSSDELINDFTLNDNRFELKIIKKIDEYNSTRYYINIKTIDDTPVRLSQSVVK